MSNARRIAKNSGTQIAAFGAKAVSLFVVSLLLARLAGAETLGEFTTIITLGGLFATISGFGLAELLTRQIARVRNDAHEINRLISSALCLVALLSVVAVLLMMVVGAVLSFAGTLIVALTLAGVGLAFESLSDVLGSAFRGVEEMQWSAAIDISMEVVFLALAAVVIPLSGRIDIVMVAYLVARLCSFGFGVYVFRSRFGKLSFNIDIGLWKNLLFSSFPFAANIALSLVYVRIDVLFLSYFSGNIAVGFYEVATSLAIRVTIIARAVNRAMFPFLSSKHVDNPGLVGFYTAKSIRFLVILGTLIAAILFVFSQDIITLLYGSSFLVADQALRYFALLIPVRLIDNSLATALSSTDRQGQRATSLFVAAVTNVVLNILLIPTYQIMGAVYSTILTEIVLLTMFIWYLRKEIHTMIDWQSFLAPSIGTGAIIITSLILTGYNFWILIALSIFAYSIIILWLEPSSFELWRQLARRKSP